MLSKHQKLHLEAVIKDATNEKNLEAVELAKKILESGEFPKLDQDCDIHDSLEKVEVNGKLIKRNLVSQDG